MEEKTCSCGCTHEHDEHDFEEELDTMTLTLDDNSELECAVLGVFAVEGIEDKEYIALYPIEETCECGCTTEEVEEDEESPVLLYIYKELEGDEVELSSIEDDDEYDKVADAFNELFCEDDEEEE